MLISSRLEPGIYVSLILVTCLYYLLTRHDTIIIAHREITQFSYDAEIVATSGEGSLPEIPQDDAPPLVSYYQEYLDGSRSLMTGPSRPNSGMREAFINTTIAVNHIDKHAFVGLLNKCQNVTWVPSLVFSCAELDTVFVSSRAQILSCLRFAVEAGAGFVLPTFPRDHEEDETGTSMGVAYDLDLFLSLLGSTCPQMQIYDNIDAVKSHGDIQEFTLNAAEIGGELVYKTVLKQPELWRARFNAWFAAQEPAESLTYVVTLGRMENVWPVCHDGDDFARTFGHLLSPRADIERLVASAYYTIVHDYQLTVNPAKLILPRTFSGAQSYWGNENEFRRAADRLMGEADKVHTHVIYISAAERRAQDRLWMQGYPRDIIWKALLLSTEENDWLGTQPPFVQDMIDFLILQKTSFYIGPESTMYSWTGVLMRERGQGAARCKNMEPWKGVPKDAVFRNDRAVIFGAKNVDTDAWMAAIWP